MTTRAQSKRTAAATLFGMALSAVLGAMLVVGCATPKALSVNVLNANEFAIGRRRSTLDGLPDALRSARATPATEILVSVPANADTNMMTPISARLSSAGYRKVIFARPRQATATVERK